LCCDALLVAPAPFLRYPSCGVHRTLSRSYHDDGTEYDGEDKEKLQMLET
jgi:hypothetical protein